MTEITWSVADEWRAIEGNAAFVSLSEQSQSAGLFDWSRVGLLPLSTFDNSRGALLQAHRVPALRQRLTEFITENRIDLAVTTMSHVWSPFFDGIWRKAGVRHVVVVHDAVPHPGDVTARVHNWIMRTPHRADAVVTLSDHVADALEQWVMPGKPVIRMFLPNLGKPASQPMMNPGGIVRFLFFGRIARYKGLPLFAEAVSLLRERGTPFEAAIVGQGDLGSLRAKLERAGVMIENRWLGEKEIPDLLGRFDVLVNSHIEASQSGVVALGLGAGLPSIVTPVGGLPAQIRPGVDGIVATGISPEAVAQAMHELAVDPSRVARLKAGARATKEERSYRAFAARLHRELQGTL